ncbi:hypothetical protein ACTFIY_004546, partial [Dictyostelium cf. discoideum]
YDGISSWTCSRRRNTKFTHCRSIIIIRSNKFSNNSI